MDVDQQIIEEGKKLIELKGFRKFTMDELARNLRISKKTIYIHFSSKDELIGAIIDSIIATDLLEMKKLIDEKEDYVEKMQAVFFLYNIKMLRKQYMNELRQYLPHEWEKFKTFSENRQEYVRRIYDEGVAQGVFIKKIPNIPNTPMQLREAHTVDLLIFLLRAIIDQAIETDLTDYEFDINTVLIHSYKLIIQMFLVDQERTVDFPNLLHLFETD
ncbi:TetR/AcrR family transcriptional regulator [Lentibacillus saliphilus]|uniref:TetR/AcrR family transcriptional regulator n=1 Tax=Lentibacillus saliphilus TaxID=2737028 RepID=UPI001C2FA8B3|nr:TetR/AcrR family transcriptional regulator [Lentibacillus saliphilus]